MGYLVVTALLGTSTLLRTDQVGLKWLRWRLRLAEFEFTINYRPGVKNSLADGCSRVISSGSDTTQCKDAIPTAILTFICADYNSDCSEDSVYSLKTLIPNVSDLPKAIKTHEILDAQHSDSEFIAWSANSRLRNCSKVNPVLREGFTYVIWLRHPIGIM
jgi:hypothetical protein